MIPLLYCSVQTLLVLLWLLDWKYWPRIKNNKVRTSIDPQTGNHLISVREGLWYAVFILSVLGAITTALGGTSKYSTNPYKL